MKRSLVLSLLAILAVCGCQVKEEGEFAPEGKSFTATMEATVGDATDIGTKTSLDNLNVLWKQGDQVSIFAGSTINERYQVTDASDGKATAALNRVTSPGFVAGGELSTNVAYYPYTSTASIAKSGNNYVISDIALPATQDYAEDSFGNGAFPMAAVTTSTSDLSLKFKNVLGSLKLQLKGTATIASISITGNNGELLCGAASVTVSNTGTPSITLTSADGTTATLDCGDGVQLDENTATAFIIALPPMTMTGGFTVVVTDTEGGSMEIKTTKSQTIARSNLLKMPAVTYVGTAPEPAVAAVDLGLPSGLKWATCNVGANAPEEYGDYFAWGETEPYYSSKSPLTWKDGKSAGYGWASYQWCNGSNNSLTKYNKDSSCGIVDDKTTLDLADDTARANWGGSWRMPTDEEWTELRTECSWTWTTQNGVNGRLVTGPNGNSIFLPAAGEWFSANLLGSGSTGYYWSSTLNGDNSSKANIAFLNSGAFNSGVFDRIFGLAVRPVSDEGVAVASISLDQSSIALTEGSSTTLTATVLPENVTQPALIWSSSDTGVATVSSEGVVTAVSAGTATITATTYDGGLTASCAVTVTRPTSGTENGHGWVDLGLPSGILWATCNVGTDTPTGYGDFFAWGETEPYYNDYFVLDATVSAYSPDPSSWRDGKRNGYYWPSYQWYNVSDNSLTKYNTHNRYGTVDNKIILELVDDAAHANWGGSWRMPTDADWTELRTKCTWSLIIQNGVCGSLVTGPNGNSIFLPSAGFCEQTLFSRINRAGYYWSSSLYIDYSDSPDEARSLYFNSDGPFSWGERRCLGYSVRPVSDEGVRIPVTGIFLDRTSLALSIGETATITATVSPSDATQNAVIWSSSNTSVATVSRKGKVTPVAAGTATITATTYDGGLTASCVVTVTRPSSGTENGHGWVDLGLSSGLMWATCNVGASAPEEYGDYFAWGETEPYYSSLSPLTWNNGKSQGYDWQSYQWCNGSDNTMTRYCTNNSYGTVDNKTVLEPEYDAAHVNWGGSWRMPTLAEWEELIGECTWTWTTQNGVNGRLVTGPNGNSIFLPATGYRYRAYLYNTGVYGNYWSSSLETEYSSGAWGGYFTSGYVRMGNSSRCSGSSVRAVSDEGVKVAVTSISLDQSSITLTDGSSTTLTSTVLPANATQPAVIWSSSDTGVATVSFEGVVTAVSAGTATITATTYDGGLTASCAVTVPRPTSGTENGHGWVDLGLPSGLRWATCNIGTNTPTGYGTYFAWGETGPSATGSYDWDSYKWSDGDYNLLTKYNTSSSYGSQVDNKTVLELADDAAKANWAGGWRMPTNTDWSELYLNCSVYWAVSGNVSGLVVTGPNGNSIFLPAAGSMYGDTHNQEGTMGFYWSSSLYNSNPSKAYGLIIDSRPRFLLDVYYRFDGFSVRPVLD
ncbi:MAG: Ig-like domain-containing protein [Bacteroidales bacterium]|nr:Ig-like domain-containing protein [Bacteroidales bacterium]